MKLTLRVIRAVVAGSFALASLAAPALAQKKADVPVAGRFEAQFEKVSDNCKDTTGMNLGTAVVELGEPKKGRVDVTVPMVPIMSGVVSRGGKFKAEVKRGKTAIEGVDGRFSVAGRVEGNSVQFLFIAEYYRGTKPICTQSWNATGSRR
jgi:hypothetical protein